MDETMFEIGMRTHKLMVEQLKGQKDEHGNWVGLCLACDGTGLTHTKSYDAGTLEAFLGPSGSELFDQVRESHANLVERDLYINAMTTEAFFIMLAEAGLNISLDDLRKTEVYRDYEEHL